MEASPTESEAPSIESISIIEMASPGAWLDPTPNITHGPRGTLLF